MGRTRALAHSRGSGRGRDVDLTGTRTVVHGDRSRRAPAGRGAGRPADVRTH
jgi:hypothetical protein